MFQSSQKVNYYFAFRLPPVINRERKSRRTDPWENTKLQSRLEETGKLSSTTKLNNKCSRFVPEMSANTYTPITNTLSHTGTKRIHTLSSFLPCAGLRYCFSSRDSSAGREAFQTAQSWHTSETRLHSEAVKNPFRMYCRITPKPVPKNATHINICSDSSLLSAGQYACFSLEFCTTTELS